MSEAWIERLIDAQLAQYRRKDPQLVSYLKEVGGLRLYLTLGSEGFLRPDGSVWIHEHENWGEPEPPKYVWREAEGRERIGALVLGAEKFAEVGRLLPERPVDADSCDRCEGVGRVLHGGTGPGVICSSCGGLGWVPAAA